MGRSRKLLLSLGFFLAAGWIYWPAMHGGWIWDDHTEIEQIAAMQGPRAMRNIWIEPNTGDYYPVKTTLEWLQWQDWGNNTFGYHLTNVFLHACSALLLWELLRKLGVRWAALGGLLFLVHPVAVESVAWVDELKNTLSLPFLLLAMMAYLDYDDFREARVERIAPNALARLRPPASALRSMRSSYLFSLLFFLLAMLSKSSVVMFPFILLLFIRWRRGVIRAADLRATAPFFAISLVLGLVAIWFQRHHGFGGTQVIPFGGALTRTARAGLIAASYFFKSVIPAGLMPVYSRWSVDPASPIAYLPWLVVAVAFAWLWARRSAWARDAIFGLGWFFVNLAPVLGFIPISHMRFAWTMDHLAYVPLLGLAGLAAAGIGAMETRIGGPGPDKKKRLVRWTLGAGAGVLCLVLAAASRDYAAIFRNEEAFWTYAVEHNPNAWLAHNNLGDLLLDRGDAQAAIPHYEQALRLNPDYPEAEYNIGLACADLGRLPEAMAHYAASLRLEPVNVGARNNLGNALLRLGRLDEAIGQYREAVRLAPADVLAHCNWGVALVRLGRLDEAIAQYEDALRVQPNFVPARLGLGSALAQAGRTSEAIGQFEAAVRVAPNNPTAREYLQRAQAAERP